MDNLNNQLEEKFCRKGNHMMPITEFSSDKSNKNGLRSTCRLCTCQKNKRCYINKKAKNEILNILMN